MNALLRTAVAAVALAALPVCVFGLRLASDPAGLVGLRDMMRAAYRDEELQGLRQATFRRLASQRRVVQEVIARRRSLGEALAAFRDLEREWPDYLEVSRRAWPSEEERHYQCITGMAQSLLGERPAEAAAALRRLEQEYRQLRAGRPAVSATPLRRTGPRR